MQQPFLGIFIVFTLFLILYLNYRIIRRLFYFFKNYLSEINAFIQSNNLNLIEIRNPKNGDWKENPFRTNNSMFIEIALPFTLLVHYTFIVTNKEKEIVQYWLRNSSPFIGKVKTEIREADTTKILLENGEIPLANIHIINDKCPACLEQIKSNDIECSSCGLVFE